MSLQFYRTVTQLTPGQSSGIFQVQVPFNARYAAIYNLSLASASLTEGQTAAASPNAMTVQPMTSVAVEIRTSTAVTLGWQSPTPLPAPTIDQPQQVTLLFSTDPINLAVGAMNTGEPAQVEVANTVTAIIEGTPNGGTNYYPIKTDGNGNIQVLPLIGGNPVTNANPLPIAGTVQANSLVGGTAVSNANPLPIKDSGPGLNNTGIRPTPYSGLVTTSFTGNTQVKGSAGVIGTISNLQAATSPSITVYDNFSGSGKILWTGTLAAGQVLPLGLPCATGIYVAVTSGDLTVSYA